MPMSECKKPLGDLEKVEEEAVICKGWTFEGFYVDDVYYERATRQDKERWFKFNYEREKIKC